MLPFTHLTHQDKDLKPETRTFLNKTLLSLLNTLARKGVDVKLVDILGEVDIFIFRGIQVTIFAFSHSKQFHQPEYSEFSLDDIKGLDVIAELTSPRIIENTSWVNVLTNELHCVEPIIVAFPSSYLNLSGSESRKRLCWCSIITFTLL